MAQAVEELGTRLGCFSIRVSCTGPSSVRPITHGRFDSDFRGWIYAILGNPNRGRPMVGVFMLLLCCGEFVSLQEQCEIRRPRPTKAQLKGKRNDAPGRVTRATNRLRRRIDLPESESVREGIGRFVAVRKLSNHPVAVHRWVEN